MKTFYLLIISLVSVVGVNAQTWTGASNNDFYNPANWNPMVTPTANDFVILPGGLGRYPIFFSNVTVRSIDMQTGSRIDVNGFQLTVLTNDFTYFIGATFNNSDAGSDIVLNIKSASLGFTTFFRGNTINDNIIFYLDGVDPFREGDAGPSNQFNGNVTYNIIGTVGVFISQVSPSIYTGNVTVNRTVKGQTNMFFGGASIAGNYSFTDNTGSITLMGDNAFKTDIAGTIDITLNDPSTNSAIAGFQMHRLINHTTGGTINVSNPAGFLLERDTLKLAALNITGARGNVIGQAIYNDINAAVNISNNIVPLGQASTFITNNTFTGGFTLTKYGPGYPVHEAANHFIGNTVINCAGEGPVQLCYIASSVFDGDLTINRTVAGNTEAFVWGATINGNFVYSNNTAGYTHLGNFFAFPNRKTAISGTVNITAHYTTPDVFALDDITNLTPGGNVEVLNSKGVDFKFDTLLVNNVTITGYKDELAQVYSNKISGNFVLADDASNSIIFYTDLRNNTISGTSSITTNGAGGLLDAYTNIANTNYGSKYLGNVTYTRNNGQIYIGEGGSSINVNEYGQDLTFNTASNLFLGALRFIGSSAGSIEQLGIQPLLIQDLSIAKTGTAKLTLKDSVTVGKTATFTSGVMVSNTSTNLIFADNATQSGASNASYVDGPVLKIGNDAFIFPIGNAGFYAPATISAPAQSGDAFRAQYFKTPPAGSGYNPSQKDFTINHVSSLEYWLLNRIEGSSAVYITLSWDVARSGVINNTADLRISHWNGTKWTDEGGVEITGTTSGTIKSLNPISNFSPFTLASSTALNPLPVTLISFNASAGGANIVYLTWVTDNEQGFSHFEVERRTNGAAFRGVTNLPAKNSPGRHSYSSTDYNAFVGTSIYRLKMVDIDGKFTYSADVRINAGGASTVNLSPNPAKNILILNNVQAFKIARVIDLHGKVQKQQVLVGNTEQMNISSLANGIYLIELDGTQGKQTLRFIKN